MHANLMRASCAEPAAHQGVPVTVRENGVRCLTRNTCRIGNDPATICGITPQRQCDPSFEWLQRAADNRQVFLEDAGSTCIALHAGMHARRKSNHDDAGSVFIETADKSRTYVFSVANPPENAIEQGSGPIAERWMDDHPRWFVHGDQRIVFVQNVEWHRFRSGAFAHAGLVGQRYLDGGSFTNMHRRPARRRLIDRYQTIGYPSLRTNPRHPGHLGDPPDQHLIQPQARIATIRREVDNQKLLLVYLCRRLTITHWTVERRR